MNISANRILHLLDLVGQAIINDENPREFDIERFFLNHQCSAGLADLLSDYLPAACGHVFCKEREIETSGFYQRIDANGNLGPEQKFDDDPIWKIVKRYSVQLATHAETRQQFSLFARQSEHVDALNQAFNDGKTWEDLKGATFGNEIFHAPLKPL